MQSVDTFLYEWHTGCQFYFAVIKKMDEASESVVIFEESTFASDADNQISLEVPQKNQESISFRAKNITFTIISCMMK